jgi:signal peptidase I
VRRLVARILAVVAGVLLGLDAAYLLGPDTRTLVVRSGSMAPAIPVGSLVVVERTDPRLLRVGDVVAFAALLDGAPSVVTHRLVSLESSATGIGARTKGDANAVPDPWTVVFAAGEPSWRVTAVAEGVGRGLIELGARRRALQLGAGVSLLLFALVEFQTFARSFAVAALLIGVCVGSTGTALASFTGARVDSGNSFSTKTIAPATALTSAKIVISVSLTWTASSDADVTSYDVFRGATSGGPYSAIANVAAAAYTDATPPVGQNCYVVVAVTSYGWRSANSNQTCQTVP